MNQSNMQNVPRKILVVDNDQAIVKRIKNLFADEFQVPISIAYDWESGLYHYNTGIYDLVIVSLYLEDLPGTVLIQKWRNHESSARRHSAFLLMSTPNIRPADEALISELEDVATVLKPFDPKCFLKGIQLAMNMQKLRVWLQEYTDIEVNPLINKGKYKEAMEVAKTRLEKAGPRGLVKLASIAEKIGDKKAAIGYWKQLIKAQPRNIGYINELARMLMTVKDFDAAKELYDKTDHLPAKCLGAIEQMAVLYLFLNRPETTIPKYRELMRADSASEVKLTMYDRLNAAGFEVFADDFCAQTATPKEVIRYYNNQGVILARDQKLPEAIENYRAALRLIPGYTDTYNIRFNMALAMLKSKKSQEVKEAKEILQDLAKKGTKVSQAKDILHKLNNPK